MELVAELMDSWLCAWGRLVAARGCNVFGVVDHKVADVGRAGHRAGCVSDHVVDWFGPGCVDIDPTRAARVTAHVPGEDAKGVFCRPRDRAVREFQRRVGERLLDRMDEDQFLGRCEHPVLTASRQTMQSAAVIR